MESIVLKARELGKRMENEVWEIIHGAGVEWDLKSTDSPSYDSGSYPEWAEQQSEGFESKSCGLIHIYIKSFTLTAQG